MGWNGADLVTEYSRNLGDTTDSFKALVEGWINDIERDICKATAWGFLRVKGSKILTASQEEQPLVISAPIAPTVALAAGGSLTSDTNFYVKVTFYDPTSKNEKTGVASAVALTTSVNKTINVSSIPLSTESFFTQRRVYLKEGTGKYYLYSTIADNTTTTASLTAVTTSKIQPPDYDYIRQIDGNLFFESNQGQLYFTPVDQMRALYATQFTDGTPETWGDMGEARVLMYPRPSSALVCKFYYMKVPRGTYNDADSTPTLSISLKEVLEAGIEWKGYKYRDREGWQMKKQNYEFELKKAIDEMRRTYTRTITRVRDTMGNADGRSYS